MKQKTAYKLKPSLP